MASGGKGSSEYNKVLENIASITEHLQLNPDAKDSLIDKYRKHKWLALTAKPTENGLVTLVLGRIENDVQQYGEFIAMLEGIVGMDAIVTKIKGHATSDTSGGGVESDSASPTPQRRTQTPHVPTPGQSVPAQPCLPTNEEPPSQPPTTQLSLPTEAPQIQDDGDGKAEKFIPYYRNSHSGTHGLALVISNKTCGDLEKRECAPWDEKHFDDTLKALGYRVILKKDQTAEEMKELFVKIQKNDDPQLKIKTEDDSFVCCIISHGGWDTEKGADFIYGSDKEKFYLQEVVYEKLNAVVFEALRAKPKMFFVQSCRGSQVSRLAADGDKTRKSLRLPCDSDFFISYSTALDTKAFRRDPSKGETVDTCPYDSEIGSIYITKLCDALMKYAPALDVANIVFTVHQTLQASKDGLLPYDDEKTRQCPQLITSLRGPFFFRKEAETLFKEYIKKCLKTCEKKPLQ